LSKAYNEALKKQAAAKKPPQKETISAGEKKPFSSRAAVLAAKDLSRPADNIGGCPQVQRSFGAKDGASG